MHIEKDTTGTCDRVCLPRELLLCIAFLALFLWPGDCRAETAVIDVQYRTARELFPIVENMVSGKGRVTLHPPTNSLVVTASSETIQQVREVLGRLDQPVQQVRVRVRFEEERLEQGQALSGDVTASGDDWKVTTGRRQEDGVDIRLQDQSRRKSQTADTVVTVMSGTEAYISVGEDLPVSNRWHRLCRRYGAGCDDCGFRHMETGLQVIPILREGYAVLQITPLISGMGTRPGSVKFTEAATTVRVPLKEWVRIGGSDQNANEVIREILSAGRREQGSSVSLWLKVEPYM